MKNSERKNVYVTRIDSNARESVPGTVFLVGAGPGHPDLLTVKAHRLLTSARVVAHDELVSPEILALVPRDAELFSVGRRALPSPKNCQVQWRGGAGTCSPPRRLSWRCLPSLRP